MTNIDFYPEWRNEKYYFFADDLRKYPDAWCYVVWSRRGSGKTYSALRFAYENKIPIVYMKRTIDDVETICANDKGIDLSPYVPINRDAGYTIKPRLIRKGIGGFYSQMDSDGNAIGDPFSYIIALNAMKTVKGMDMSFADWMLLDEFIPQVGETIRHAEGQMLLDMYMTISRDREKRGRDSLKLVLFANAENISTPITSEMEIIDDMVDLVASGQSHKYLEDRGILIHYITDEEIPITEEERGGIYKAMKGTAWGEKAFGGLFSANDFSNVGHKRLKGFQPIARFRYKRKNYCIWRKEEYVFVCKAQGNAYLSYDLDKENDQKLFYVEIVRDLREDTANGYVTYDSYSLYDLIMNFRKIYKI